MFDDGNPEREGQLNALSAPEVRVRTIRIGLEHILAAQGSIKDSIAIMDDLSNPDRGGLSLVPETPIYQKPPQVPQSSDNLTDIRARIEQAHDQQPGDFNVSAAA